MDFSEVVALRHSVRHFTPEEVEREKIDRIIEVAQTAPSSKNSHSTGFMIVQDRDLLDAFSRMRTHGSSLLGRAAAAIVVLGDSTKTDLWVDNCSISATFLQLAAVNEGLGSCWVHVNGRLRDPEDPSKGDAEGYLRELLGIKDNMRVHCVVALGYEDKEYGK